jgi:hypothetical protein
MSKVHKIANHLLEHRSITSWEAITLYRATRLPAVIFLLKKRGYKVTSVWETSVNSEGEKSRYVRYRLEQ